METDNLRRLQRILIGVCVVGTLTFGSGFLMTLVARSTIEYAVKAFLVTQVAQEVAVQLGISNLPNDGILADSLVGNLPPGMSVKEFSVVRPHQVREKYIREIIEAENASKISQNYHRHALIRSNYQRILDDFMQEFRVFTGINCILFAIVAGLIGRRPTLTHHLLVPAGILVATNCIAIVIYIIAQDWLFAILAQDFIGFWYLTYVGIVTLFLVDIVCNDGRVCAMIMKIRSYWHV